jgi:hypothetical protein
MPTPASRPQPISSTTMRSASSLPITFDLASAVARMMSSNGTQMPSLRPLSTFSAWRIRAGTRSLVTPA